MVSSEFLICVFKFTNIYISENFQQHKMQQVVRLLTYKKVVRTVRLEPSLRRRQGNSIYIYVDSSGKQNKCALNWDKHLYVHMVDTELKTDLSGIHPCS